MGEATVIILHPPPVGSGALTELLHEAHRRLAEAHADRFTRAGATDVRIDRRPRSLRLEDRLDELAAAYRGRGLVLLGAGSVPRLTTADASRLIGIAAGGGRRAATNNRASSDIIAVSDAHLLAGLVGADSDNVLPRRLAGRGVQVIELPGRERLALDLDTPLDIALASLARETPRAVRGLARERGLAVPRIEPLRALSADPRRELLVFGRSSARTLAWLERHTACRVRFLAEERGLRTATPGQRPPRATLGRLLADRGPQALAAIIGELADGALLDTRVLLADRFGPGAERWPTDEDRFASDLLHPDEVVDPWLRALTAAASDAAIPIILGGHTLVSSGPRLMLGAPREGPTRALRSARIGGDR